MAAISLGVGLRQPNDIREVCNSGRPPTERELLAIVDRAVAFTRAVITALKLGACFCEQLA